MARSLWPVVGIYIGAQVIQLFAVGLHLCKALIVSVSWADRLRSGVEQEYAGSTESWLDRGIAVFELFLI